MSFETEREGKEMKGKGKNDAVTGLAGTGRDEMVMTGQLKGV